MKTNEQVLKEWMSDRIAFAIGRRKFFTQYEFAAVTDTLCNKELTAINRYGIKRGAFKLAVRASNLTLRMDQNTKGASVQKFVHINMALGAPEHKALRDPRQLARFESANELYDYLTKKDAGNGIVRTQVVVRPVLPVEKIKVTFQVLP